MTRLIFWSLCLYFVLNLPHLLGATENNAVVLVNQWKNLEFQFDNAAQMAYAIEKGYYLETGMKRPYDSDVYTDKNGVWRSFIAIPRVGRNIPFTFGEVNNLNGTDNGPFLKAYPSMEWHLNRTCDKVFAVFRFWIDQRCNQVWLMDSGRDFFASSPPTQKCPPKIVVFDLKTNQLVFKHEIPSTQYTPEVSIFNSITLMSGKACGRATAFLLDARGPGLIVFDERTKQTWRTASDLYKADPQYYPTTIANETFNFIDGLYSVVVSPFTKLLYGHPFAARYEFAVPSVIVTNKVLWSFNTTLPQKFFKRIGERPTQSPTQAIDTRGNIWFTLMDPLAVFCWNPINPYSFEYFKRVTSIEDSVYLEFVAGMKVRRDPKTKKELLFMVSNRLQKHNTGTVNPNEINYRTFYLKISGIDCINI